MTHVTVVLEDLNKSVAPKTGGTKPELTKPVSLIKGTPAPKGKAPAEKTVGKTAKSPTAKSKARGAQDVTIRVKEPPNTMVKKSIPKVSVCRHWGL